MRTNDLPENGAGFSLWEIDQPANSALWDMAALVVGDLAFVLVVEMVGKEVEEKEGYLKRETELYIQN